MELMTGTTNSTVEYQLRDIYSLGKCCWNDINESDTTGAACGTGTA